MSTPNPISTAPSAGAAHARSASEAEAHAALDDDGNPLRPDEPPPPPTWRDLFHAAGNTARSTLRSHPVGSVAVAFAAGFLIGRLRAARAERS